MKPNQIARQRKHWLKTSTYAKAYAAKENDKNTIFIIHTQCNRPHSFSFVIGVDGSVGEVAGWIARQDKNDSIRFYGVRSAEVSTFLDHLLDTKERDKICEALLEAIAFQPLPTEPETTEPENVITRGNWFNSIINTLKFKF